MPKKSKWYGWLAAILIVALGLQVILFVGGCEPTPPAPTMEEEIGELFGTMEDNLRVMEENMGELNKLEAELEEVKEILERIKELQRQYHNGTLKSA